MTLRRLLTLRLFRLDLAGYNPQATVPSNDDHPILYTVLGLNRAGKFFYTALFVLAVPIGVLYFVFLPRWRFSDEDERLFRAARHGDLPGVERSIAAGGHINGLAPIDRKTVLFRAAVFGHANVVTWLLSHGADPTVRGSDGRTALEVVTAARGEEKDPAAAEALERVMAMLREIDK